MKTIKDRYDALNVGKYSGHKDFIFANHLNTSVSNFTAMLDRQRNGFNPIYYKRLKYRQLIELIELYENV